MKAPTSLRTLLLTLLVLSILIPFGCKWNPPVDCCPGNGQDLCPDLFKELENLAQSNVLDFTPAQDSTGCPIAENQWIVKIDEWCDWPLYRAMRSMPEGGWGKVLEEIQKNPCIIIRDSANNRITIKIEEPSAILRVCPCDSTLIVLDSSKLNTQEGGAIAKSSGGPQGNGILMLPKFAAVLDNKNLGIKGFTGTPDGTRKIAIIDTGIDKEYLTNIPENLQSFCNILDPYTFPHDEHGHGTMVTSIIDQASSRKKEFSDHQFLIYKAFDENGVGTVFDVVCALAGARNQGADLINMSWGTPVDHEYLRNSIKSFDTKVTPLIASKGNDCIKSTSSVPINYPADYDNVYDVAALDLSMGKIVNQSWLEFHKPLNLTIPSNVQYWNCSNWGDDEFQLMGPGKIISEIDNLQTFYYGSSYSAAYVTGVMAGNYFQTGNYPIYTESEINNFTTKRRATPNDGIPRDIWIAPKQ